MNAPVVLVTHDSRGETEVRMFADLTDADAGRPFATVRRRELWIDTEAADDWISDMAMGLARNELRTDRKADLSWMATHRVVGGLLEPIQRSAA